MHGLLWEYIYTWALQALSEMLLCGFTRLCWGDMHRLFWTKIRGFFRLFRGSFCADSLGSFWEICMGSFEDISIGSSGSFGDAFVRIRKAFCSPVIWVFFLKVEIIFLWDHTCIRSRANSLWYIRIFRGVISGLFKESTWGIYVGSFGEICMGSFCCV